MRKNMLSEIYYYLMAYLRMSNSMHIITPRAQCTKYVELVYVMLYRYHVVWRNILAKFPACMPRA